MPEKGKIRRLPEAIREELNQRLQDGADYPALEEWLNGLPEVEAVMAGKYRGATITQKNLSDWKKGGFLEWEARQETVEVLEECRGEAGEAIPAALGEKLSRWVAMRYAAAARDAAGEAHGSAEELKVLRNLSMDVARLRRGDQNAQWLELEARVQQHRERNAQLKVAETVLEVAEDPKLHEKICPQCSQPVCYTPKLYQVARCLYGDELVDGWEQENAAEAEAQRKVDEERARQYAEAKWKVQVETGRTFAEAVMKAQEFQAEKAKAEEGAGRKHQAPSTKHQKMTKDQAPNPKE